MIKDSNLVLVTDSATTAVSLAEAKAHLRVDHSDEDSLISTLIDVATSHVEDVISRDMITRTWQRQRRDFADVMPLRPSLQSVTSVSYVDEDGATQVLAADQYDADTAATPGYIQRSSIGDWPAVKDQPNAVTIEFVAGYGLASSDVPAPIRQAMFLLIGHLYENREGTSAGQSVQTVPMGVDALLMPHRLMPV